MSKASFRHTPPRVGFLIAVLAFPMFSQSGAMTNAGVLELLKMGVGEQIIVAKINRSGCLCDTSNAAIAKLKLAKATDSIILAMINSSESAEQPAKPGFSDTVISVPNYSENKPVAKPVDTVAGVAELRQIQEPGIYLFENGKMLLIEPTVYSGTKSGFLGTIMTYGIMKSKVRAVVRGKSANTQVSSRRPEFYFVCSREYANAGAVMSGFGGYAATSPAEFMMIQMNVKENSREAVLGSFNSYGTSTGARDKDIREYAFEKIKPGLYKVTPKIDLANGEYCFYYAGNSGAGSKVFDYSVRQ